MSAVVKLRPAPDDVTYDDPVFFHRSQIVVGKQIRCYGRRDPNSIWRVAKIATYVKQPSGKLALRPTETIVHLDDQLWLERQGTGDKRQVTFSAISYSAIWRLV